jgi:hypothetical protein
MVFDPPCARCRDAGGGQYFTYHSGDGRVWHFDVALAAQVALANHDTLGLVAVADLLEQAARNEVDDAHIPHVDETLPLLAVTLDTGDGPAALLIDGNHRLRKLAALGVPEVQLYLLTEELTAGVIALAPDGPRSELGRLIQRGQAGAG